MSTDTQESLVASYATTSQSRAISALIVKRIDSIKDQLTQCAMVDVPCLQGAARELKNLQRVIDGSPH